MAVSAMADALLLFGRGGQKGGDSRSLIEVDQLRARKRFAGLAHLFERAIDGAGSLAEIANRVLDRPDVLVHLVHQALKLAELFFGSFKYVPDLVALLLDGKHLEAHLGAGEDGGEGAWTGDGDAAAGLDLSLQGVAAHHLGVEALCG